MYNFIKLIRLEQVFLKNFLVYHLKVWKIINPFSVFSFVHLYSDIIKASKYTFLCNEIRKRIIGDHR